MNTIKVKDDDTGLYNRFISGVFKVNPDIEREIIKKEYGSTNDFSVFYHPKTKKVYIFHHSDVWGRGAGEEVNAALPEEEVKRIEIYANNRKKILQTLFSIPCDRKGDSYIYFDKPLAKPYYEYEGWNREEQRLNEILNKYPQIKEIEKLGGSVQIGERTLSVE